MSGKEREEMGRKLLDVLEERHSLSREEWRFLLENRGGELSGEVFSRAAALRDRIYGPGRATPPSARQERTGICCAMRQPMRNITGCFIPRSRH